MITGVHYELKQELSDTKLTFGQEVLRIDRQQMGIIDKMREYEHKVNAFSVEMRKVKVDAERFAMRGENILEKAQIVYQKHRNDMDKASNELGVALEKMSLKEQGFANTVGAARVKMDHIVHQQYYALKDIAHEKMGVELLRQDYDKRVLLQNEKVARLNEQQNHLLQQIKSENAHSQALGQLTHQLRMTQENLTHEKNRSSMMQQETAIFRKLNK